MNVDISEAFNLSVKLITTGEKLLAMLKLQEKQALLTDDITMSVIMRLVAKVNGVSKEEILSDARFHKLALARQTAMYLARKHTHLSTTDVGRYFNRDHTDVCYAEKKIKSRMEVYPQFRAQIQKLNEELTKINK